MFPKNSTEQNNVWHSRTGRVSDFGSRTGFRIDRVGHRGLACSKGTGHQLLLCGAEGKISIELPQLSLNFDAKELRLQQAQIDDESPHYSGRNGHSI